MKERRDSIGFNIQLPFEQDLSRFTTIEREFNYFFSRKVMMCRYSFAFVVMPGGFGTMDELFELLTLIQTKKISKDKKIIVFDENFYGALMQFVKTSFLKYKTIDQEDLELFEVASNAKEVVKTIDTFYYKQKRDKK